MFQKYDKNNIKKCIKMFYAYFYREIWVCYSFTNNEKSGWNLVVPIFKIECDTTAC